VKLEELREQEREKLAILQPAPVTPTEAELVST